MWFHHLAHPGKSKEHILEMKHEKLYTALPNNSTKFYKALYLLTERQNSPRLRCKALHQWHPSRQGSTHASGVGAVGRLLRCAARGENRGFPRYLPTPRLPLQRSPRDG